MAWDPTHSIKIWVQTQYSCGNECWGRERDFIDSRAASTNARLDIPVASGELRVKEIKRPALLPAAPASIG